MKHSKRRPGFSLILSLTVMVGIVLLLLTLTAFITIESRAAMNQQLATRARLNGIAAMRLALAHLQQTAGPDRRSTARADITQPAATASTVKNPMWTGVWRTDFPDLPPAWLVSGLADQPAGTQSIPLVPESAPLTTKTADYPAGYWFPWQTVPALADDAVVNLVGAGSALPAEGTRVSGFVTLPKVPLPDEGINGSYAYWVGDEGIKARINLHDTRSVTAGDADQLLSLRSPVTHGLLKALPKPEELTRITRAKDATLLTGIDALGTGGVAPDMRLYFHDVSAVSAGVLADAANGGLKRDLSLAFELDDAGFAASEFGEGASPQGGTHTASGFTTVQMPVLAGSGSSVTSAAPVFSRATTGGGAVRGPAWWALRDYHRLYKQVGWTAGSTGARSTALPSLRARSLWPNVAAAHPNGTPASSGLPNNSLRNRLYGYADIYDGDLPTSLNPNAADYRNGTSGAIVTRPLNVAATPYVQRVTLAFSVNKMQWFIWKSIKIGKNVMWYQEEWVDIRLNITPIVVVHNPYNVRMTWQPGGGSGPNKTPYAAAISFSDLAGWKFRFKQYTGASATPYVYETPLSTFFNLQSPASDDEDTFRLYLTKDGSASITLEPGELRVFSCEPTIGDWTKSIVLSNTFDTRGGYRDNVWDWGFGADATDVFDIASPIAFEIVPGGKMRMRHAITSWPGDELVLNSSPGASASADKDDFFYKSSEVTEVAFSDINESKYPSPGEKFFASWRHVQDKYPRPTPQADGRIPYPSPTSPPLQPDLITAIDIAAKTADTDGAPFPLLTHSNPLAATQKPSAGGRLGDGSGATGTSPSYQLTLRGGTWLNVVASTNAGKLAFGGNSPTTAGSQRVILSEVPLVQPTSLAQYAHANFGVRDQQPLLSVGNSFATPYVADGKVMQDNGNNWTEFDQTYLLNAALWDGFFLSGAAPRMKTGNTGVISPAVPTPTKPDATGPATTDPNEMDGFRLADVIKRFVHDGVPLDNPRFSLEHGSLDPADAEAAMRDHRRAASVLLNKGAFNVNSTSVTAWQAFLGSARKLALPGAGADIDSARFPRALTKDGNSAATGNGDNPSNWSGFANLTNAQIDALAKAIVDENKARFGILRRTERDQVSTPGARLFGGLTQASTPYLSLSEFVNRFLTTEAWASRCGPLQAAILRADQSYAAGLNDRLVSSLAERTLAAAALQTPTAGFFPHPQNIEVSAQTGAGRVHTAMGAPGNLLQSDLLQAFGSAIANRSDTFTLRCYGEAAQLTGETGSAWMEVVVQRVPDFIDTVNPPETAKASLNKVNGLLGRRFKVVSMRWLKADEI